MSRWVFRLQARYEWAGIQDVSKTLNACSLNLSLKTMVNFSLALGLKPSIVLEDLESPFVESGKRSGKNLVSDSD